MKHEDIETTFSISIPHFICNILIFNLKWCKLFKKKMTLVSKRLHLAEMVNALCHIRQTRTRLPYMAKKGDNFTTVTRGVSFLAFLIGQKKLPITTTTKKHPIIIIVILCVILPTPHSIIQTEYIQSQISLVCIHFMDYIRLSAGGGREEIYIQFSGRTYIPSKHFTLDRRCINVRSWRWIYVVFWLNLQIVH